MYKCTEPPDYPDEPAIKFERLNKTTISQSGIDVDTLYVTFSFTDGDGNLGFSATDSIRDVFFTDSRSLDQTNPLTTFRIPDIADQGVGNGISGEITIALINTFEICCFPTNYPLATSCNPFTFPQNSTDTMSYSIQIMDRDSNFSNVIQTEQLIIQCN